MQFLAYMQPISYICGVTELRYWFAKNANECLINKNQNDKRKTFGKSFRKTWKNRFE